MTAQLRAQLSVDELAASLGIDPDKYARQCELERTD